MSNGDSFARAFVRGLAEERGWPCAETRHGSIGPGEGQWRRFLDACTVFQLGAAERALAALPEQPAREKVAV